MAKGGGGSWKVAYADFVTAMMAFFLVMWIGAQDTKVRQSVANYFVDPNGVAKKPVQNGAVMNSMVYGNLPNQESVSMGSGTRQYTSGEPSPSTKAMMNWINSDEKRQAYWKGKAQACRKRSREMKLNDTSKSPDEVAAQELALELQAEMTGGIPPDSPEVYKELLRKSINTDVNWAQVAHDLLQET